MKRHLRWAPAALLVTLAVAMVAAAGCQQSDQGDTATVDVVPPLPVQSVAPADVTAMVGQPAPSFACAAIDGEEIDLQEYLGKQVILLAFWTPTCPSCQQALPELVDILKELEGDEAPAAESDAVESESAAESAAAEEPAVESGADEGNAESAPAESEAAPELADFAFITVYLGEDTEAPSEYVEAHGFEFPVVADKGGTLKEIYEVSVTPQIVLIGVDGSIQAIYQGWASTHGSTVRDQLQRLRAGEDISGDAASLSMGGG